MKTTHHLFHSFSKSRRGFTLTEVLLAVMIIGLIGIALASLTRAASREGGVGRSKIMLRNNLSVFMRTLRSDMAQASYVAEVAGPITVANTSPVTLLKVAQGVDTKGNTLDSNQVPAKWITYCFVRGTDKASPIVPTGSYRGGAIYRLQNSNSTTKFLSCTSSNMTASNLLLNNVKYIPRTTSISTSGGSITYPVPLFDRNSFSRTQMKNLINVHVITELNSTPIINDVVEETFATGMGY